MSLAVVGSLNMDLVVRCSRAPRAGETVTGEGLQTLLGGKGANQAVAAAHAGASVRMFGCVGRDDFGAALRASLASANVDVSGVAVLDGVETGKAIILVDAAGENRIVVVAGANAAVETARVLSAFGDVTRALFQMELPMAVTGECLRRARARGLTVTLNAAPVSGSLPEDWWPCIDHLVVNEVEAATLAGRELVDEGSEWAALAALRERGPAAVTLTLGARGCLHHGRDRWVVPAPSVEVVDTTAAGDAFVGVYESAIDEGVEVPGALSRAVGAGSLTTTRPGAQASLPLRDEVLAAARSIHPRRV